MSGPTQRTETGHQCGNLHTTGLSPRQSQVLLLRAHGKSVNECAVMLDCSDNNIKQLITALFYKLHADNSAELITRAFQNGFLRFLSIFTALFISLSAPIQADNHNLNARFTRAPRTQNARANRNGSNNKLLITIEEIC